MTSSTKTLRLLDVSGSPYDIGLAHGEHYADEIRQFAEQRLAFCADPSFTNTGLTRQDILQMTAQCIPFHQAYFPMGMQELQGIADATALSLEEVIILNGFTDLLDVIQTVHKAPIPQSVRRDDCTAFIVPPAVSADQKPYIGQTWDMNQEATPFITMLRVHPDDSPAYTTMTVTGCIAMMGMNEEGIAIGITNLCGHDGQYGVTWTLAVRKALAQTTLDDAIDCIMDVPLAGGHNYYLADATGRCVNIEGMATQKDRHNVESKAYVHTNHCLVPHTQSVETLPDSYFDASTHARYERASELLDKTDITLADLQALTRDHGAEIGVCVHTGAGNKDNVESGAAIIMSPATQELWAVWGNPCEGEYQHFEV